MQTKLTKGKVKTKLNHLYATRKNKNIWIRIFQECEYGLEHWFILEEYEREDIKEELKEIEKLNFISCSEYTADGNKVIALQIDLEDVKK